MASSPDPQDNSRRLGDVVTRALADAGITQREAVDLTGIPHTTFRRYLSGQSSFRLDDLVKVADTLGVTVTSLIAQAEDVAA